MIKIYPYFTFNGNCRTAMSFYQKCFGGQLEFFSLSETPAADELPTPFKKLIVEAVLQNDELVIFASDMTNDDELISGNRAAMLLTFDSETTAQNTFANLSEKAFTKDLQRSISGSLVGNVTDQFGNHWIIKCIQD